MNYTKFNDDVFIVDCWTNTIEKENTLIELLNRLKIFNIPIILCGHYPVDSEIQKLVDYYLYDKNNDILLEKDFVEYGVNSDRWSNMGEYMITNKTDFHHDYAIWITMKNAFALAERLGKKYIHFLEFDNLPEEVQYRQSFIEYIRNNDAVLYEYSEGSTKENNPYCATYIFSIRTDIANKLINSINSKEEYFKGKPDRWQLEKVFYQTLKKFTDRIFVSKYIPNENELNIYAAWNRNGIIRNGARFQTYLCVDDYGQLYVHFISGFTEKEADKDYIVEINYADYKRFHIVKKGEFHLDRIGNYIQGETFKVFYQGIEVFGQELKEDVSEFRRKNKLIKRDRIINRQPIVHFVDGPYVEIKDDGDCLYNVQFINKTEGKVEFEIDLKSNHWARCSKKYYVDWLIRIKGIDNDFHYEQHLNLENKRVLICFESKSLGDNLAWIPYVDKFREEHNCQIICSSFNNDLFEKEYPKIEFVSPGSTVNNIHALYRLGVFYTNDRKIDFEKHKSDPKTEPLMKVGSDILGLKYEELKTKLPQLGKKKSKRVCIAIHSTAQCKYWNNPNGWQEVVDFLNNKGYEVRLLSREEHGYMGNSNPKGVKQQPKSTLKELIKVLQESEMFIGISSGLSWLAWASDIPTVIISGFTDEDLEPTKDIVRIINKNVCNSCWSKHEFDPSDWNWCPEYKGTDKQFECSKTITSEDVIKKIQELL